jgi:similar to stage IV sporulation protein
LNISDILSFIKGSVTIEAEGEFVERFLNICMRRGIYLCDIKRVGEQRLNAKMGIVGFREVRPIAKKTRTRVRIKKRSGLPFLIRRYKKRRWSIAGIIFFFAILWYLSTHIMGIDIIGNERISAAELRQGLADYGLRTGTASAKVDRKLLQNRMMTAFDDIAWIGINIKGSRAFVEVRERLDTKPKVDEDIPCNLVAARDGIIRGLEIRAGQTVVKINDMVEEGDLLVSGAMDSSVVGIRYEHSDGAVFAETIYKMSKEYPLEYVEKVYTDNKKARYTARIFGKDIKMFLSGRTPFEHCDKEMEDRAFGVWKKTPVLILKKETFKEYTPQKKVITEAQAASKGRDEICKELEKQLAGNAEILNKQVSYRLKDKNMVEVTAEFVCREDIAQKSVIDKIENIDYN